MANALNDTRSISYGSPYDRRNLADVYQGMKDAYINGIQAVPEWLVGKMAPEQYNRGVIASTPKDSIRAAQMHREQNIAQRRQDIGRDYEQGMDYGTALGMIADPYLDLPLAGIAKLAKVGQATRAQAKPFNALGDLAGERGAIDIPSGEAARLQRGNPVQEPDRVQRLGELPRDMREELFNEHAMNLNPEATEKGFYQQEVPSGLIDIKDLKIDKITDNYIKDAKLKDLPPIVIADGRLIDGQHRIQFAKDNGYSSLRYIDMTGRIDTNAGGFISEIPR